MLRRLLARNPRRGAAAGLLALAAVSAGGLALSSSGKGSSLPANEAISIPDAMRQLLSWSSKFLQDFSLPSFSSVSPAASLGRDSSPASASPGFTDDDVPVGRKSIVKAAAAVSPAVVNFLDPRGDRVFADNIGSGTIIDPDGTILTCAQLVADSFNAPMGSKGKVFVTSQDGRDFGGTVVNVDFSSDIALVKIQSETPLPAAKLGSSSKLQPGDFVIALGCPLLLKDTITSGIVSSVDRTNSDAGIEGIQREFLQTDCAINVGNCGGPLVNLDGEVVGVNIITQIHEADRLSFAMPIDWAIKVVEKLKKKERVVYPWLGAKMVALTEESIAILKEKDASFPDVKQGVILDRPIRESPADRAGFRLGDVLVELDGKPVGSIIEILGIMEDQAGKPLKALVKRTKDESVTLTVVPEEVDIKGDTSYQ